jgi:hypothetical protein
MEENVDPAPGQSALKEFSTKSGRSMDYDLGYVDLEEKPCSPRENPFGQKCTQSRERSVSFRAGVSLSLALAAAQVAPVWEP